MTLKKRVGNNPLDKYDAMYSDEKGNPVHGLTTEGKKALGVILSAIEGRDPRELEAWGNFLREVSLNPSYLKDPQLLEQTMAFTVTMAKKNQWYRDRMKQDKEY